MFIRQNLEGYLIALQPYTSMIICIRAIVTKGQCLLLTLPGPPPSAQLVEVVTKTGVSLDPVYSLKGVRGLLSELGKNPQRFAGRRILYIHTGLCSHSRSR